MTILLSGVSVVTLGVHTVENTAIAETRIRDIDMAKTMIEFSKYQLLE